MITRLLGLLAVVCLADLAQAQPLTKLAIPGPACVPSEATLRLERHRAGHGFVEHAPSNIDPIVFFCPITPFESAITDWALTLIFRDSTAANPSAHVQARLFRQRISGESPSGTPVAVPGARATSDFTELTTLTRLDVSFTHNFDFDSNVYWIQVDLTRSATSQTVVFYSVSLRDLTPSDIRLKHSVALLGRLDNGLGFYRFGYHGSDKAYVGVMAQEVAAISPGAVVRGDDGYLRVSYSQLGLRLQSFEDWLAAGGKIPSTHRQ